MPGVRRSIGELLQRGLNDRSRVHRCVHAEALNPLHIRLPPEPGHLAFGVLPCVAFRVENCIFNGQLTVHDLPSGYRRTAHARRLSRLESAERDAIVAALAESAGNIARTARLLEISRPTLYSRIRALHIAR